MLDSLINRIRLMFIFTFLFGSAIFYYALDNFYEKESYKLIQENVLLSESLQSYVSEFQKPMIYDLINEKKLSVGYFDPKVMSSTFIISHVNDIFQEKILSANLELDDVEIRFASDNPTNLKNKANAFESEILHIFNTTDAKSYTKRIKHNDKDTLFFAVPVRRNTQACLTCHGDPRDAPSDMLKIYGDKNGFNEKLGEIRSINAIYTTLDEHNHMITFYLIVEALMLFIFLSIYFTINHFILQLAKKDQFIAKQSKFAAMGEMISMIAHQWRQPLTGIGMTTNNMLLDIELEDIEPKRMKDSLEIVNKQVEYLSHTIDDFKNFFKPDKKPEEIDLSGTLDDSLIVIDSTLKNNSVMLDKEYADNVKVITMKNDLKQIILNLVKNAMDAYLEHDIKDRNIKIKTISEVKFVKIIISDNAGGIPEKIIDKIFDAYFSTKDEKNGTGLGLYMSKMIVENHMNGNLDVVSKNSSTTFTITIPKDGIR